LGNPLYGTPDIGAYEYQPPYTITTQKPEYTGNIRIYGDGKYRYLTATTSSVTAPLSVVPAETWIYAARLLSLVQKGCLLAIGRAVPELLVDRSFDSQSARNTMGEVYVAFLSNMRA